MHSNVNGGFGDDGNTEPFGSRADREGVALAAAIDGSV